MRMTVKTEHQLQNGAPLNTCTTIEQRGIVRFLWAKGMAAKDIHKEMLPMYGKHCLSRQADHNWVQNFSQGGGDKYRGRISSSSADVFRGAAIL